MITIKTYQRNSKQYKDIYSTNSILIIGQGINENKLNEIYKKKTSEEIVEERYQKFRNIKYFNVNI